MKYNKSTIVVTMASLLLLLSGANCGWVVYTCSDCLSSMNCASGKCYNLTGSGYPEDAA